MMIRILGPAEKPGRYKFCHVVPSETVGQWADQTGGGDNAHNINGTEIPPGTVLRSEVTAFGRLVQYHSPVFS